MTIQKRVKTHKSISQLARIFTAIIGLGLVSTGVSADDGRGKKMFDRIDVDGNGVVSFDEFKVPKKGKLKKADTNNDGQVTRTEINEHAQQRSDEALERANQRFSNMDLNDDDIVTSEEAKEAMFYRLDKDQDGYLSPEELKPRHKKQSNRKNGPRGGPDHEQNDS